MTPDDSRSTSSLNPLPTWLSPWNYPTRVTDDLAINIAVAVWHGADFRAAGMLYGVAPSRLMTWLKWGAEAYRRDADGNDPQAAYLNFFLKLLQATGLAAVPAQQQTYTEAPGWWLTHNPEHRSGWGAPASQLIGSPLDAEPSEIELSASATPPIPIPSVTSMRTILKTLISSGAAIESGDLVPNDEPSDDADAGHPGQLNAG